MRVVIIVAGIAIIIAASTWILTARGHERSADDQYADRMIAKQAELAWVHKIEAEARISAHEKASNQEQLQRAIYGLGVVRPGLPEQVMPYLARAEYLYRRAVLPTGYAADLRDAQRAALTDYADAFAAQPQAFTTARITTWRSEAQAYLQAIEDEFARCDRPRYEIAVRSAPHPNLREHRLPAETKSP